VRGTAGETRAPPIHGGDRERERERERERGKRGESSPLCPSIVGIYVYIVCIMHHEWNELSFHSMTSPLQFMNWRGEVIE
jgi:hypothetical protein